VCLNGRAAEALYRRRVLPTLGPRARALRLIALPSTSPAHAARSLAAKLVAWRAVARAAHVAMRHPGRRGRRAGA
jgi:G:T/U-mismatch repair DNA glycosylase